MAVGSRDDRDREPTGEPEGIHHRVEESELMLAHARAFMDALAEGDGESQQYLTELKDSLERNLDRLRRRKDGRD